MRNARSKSTFKPRWRQRTSGQAGKRHSLLKGVTSSASQETYDPEVIGWVSRVNSAGGSVSNATVDAANSFIRSINASEGLRAKIQRLNLFSGSNLSASLTPLIVDVGPSQDSNNNFTSAEYTASTGLTNSSGSGNKYLDTGIDFGDAGISFTDGHIAINTLGSSTSSSYKEWIGRDHACIGSNLSTGKHHFRWGEHLLETSNTNPQQGTSMGFYLGNASSTEVSLSLNNNKKVTKTITSNAPSNAVDKNFYIFKRNTVYTSPNDFDKTVNFYSIGKNLTDAQAKALYGAVTTFNHSLSREVYDAQDLEAWEWANHRLQEVLGDVDTHFSSALVQVADKWITDLKRDKIREKISRANLFLGVSSSSYAYLAALVPLIIDKGNRTDTNVGFINSDYNLYTGLKGNGVNKYLDTGYSGGANHVSVVASSLTMNTVSTATANNLIGVNDYYGAISIGLSTTKASACYGNWLCTSAAVSSSEGMFLASIESESSQRLYYNGENLGIANSNMTSDDWWRHSAGTKNITVFARKVANGSTTAYSDQTLQQYTIGDTLSAGDAANLNTLNSEVLRTELTATNAEVYKWANQTVPNNGGKLTQSEVDAVDAWMTKVKSVSGLQAKIKRANLMVGSDLATKLVPIISTLGSVKDSAKELYDSDTNVKGVNGGLSKYIDTTVELSEFLTNSSGHFSVQHSKNFAANANGNAHGVFSTSSTKPKFGIQFDNNSIDSYIYNTANAASFATTNPPTSTVLWGYYGSDPSQLVDGSAVSASLGPGNSVGNLHSFGVYADTTAWSLTSPSTGLMTFEFRSCVYRNQGAYSFATEPYWFDVYLNGVFAKRYDSPSHDCENLGAWSNSFAVDVKAGDSVVVKARCDTQVLMSLAGMANVTGVVPL